MAVYTRVGDADLATFLQNYELDACLSFKEIVEGVENSNFLLETVSGRFILTIFEKRVARDDLPWFMGLMAHLNARGVPCPLPVQGKDGRILHMLLGKAAVVTTFLSGRSAVELTESHCHKAGRCLAQLHQAARNYPPHRPNAFGPSSWRALYDTACKAATSLDAMQVTPEIEDLIVTASETLPIIISQWPHYDTLPSGHIHADFFPDNVFFGGESELTGVIDFYFACSDFLAYDLAIALNAWCFTDDDRIEPAFFHAMIAGYQSVRPLDAAEKASLPLLAQGAALRFMLTRLYDWISTPQGALVTKKDPAAFMRRLVSWQKNSALEIA